MKTLPNPDRNGNNAINCELLPPEAKPTGHLERLRGALTSGYALAGSVGARRVQLQMLDGLAALKVLS